jgi:hypothetical protein
LHLQLQKTCKPPDAARPLAAAVRAVGTAGHEGCEATAADAGCPESDWPAVPSKPPALNLTESSIKKAKDDLLMHAALKEKAMKYKVNISQSDLDSEMASIYSTYGGKAKFNRFAKPEGVYNFLVTNSENEIYKNKLQQQVLSHKKLLIVGINIDTPYFNKFDSVEQSMQIQVAKQKLKNEYYPLFQKGEKAGIIILKANGINTVQDRYKLEWTGMQIGAYTYTCSDIIDNCFNDVPYYNVANATQTSSKLKSLTKKGQFTDVFVSKAGFVEIIRLEDQYGENYTSWNDFLGQFNKQYSNQLNKMD